MTYHTTLMRAGGDVATCRRYRHPLAPREDDERTFYSYLRFQPESATGLATERSEGLDHLEAADGLADTTPDSDTRTARALQGLDTEEVDLAVEVDEGKTLARADIATDLNRW